MIDNFEQIKSLLKFRSPDTFYFCQIIKRRKENPDAENNNTKLRSYYLTGIEHLESKAKEIREMSAFFNARAYINLNPRSFEEVGKDALIIIADYIRKGDWNGIKHAYETACGNYKSGKLDRTWLVDIDSNETEHIESVGNFIKELQEAVPNNRYTDHGTLATIPTKNGVHLIVRPFDSLKFREKYKEDFHPNNPTILYIP